MRKAECNFIVQPVSKTLFLKHEAQRAAFRSGFPGETLMKPRVILSLNADAEVEGAATQAALVSRHGVRVAKTAPNAFKKLGDGLEDVRAHGRAGGAALMHATESVNSVSAFIIAPLARCHHGILDLSKAPLPASLLRFAIPLDDFLRPLGCAISDLPR